MNSALLSCSMMCASLWSGAEKVLAELEAGSVELLHADVMDGVFVPNMMLGTDSIKQLRKISNIPLDIHLMIEQPEDKLGWFDLQEGEWVSIHVESTKHLQRALTRIREYGAKPMVAINPATPLCMIEDVLVDVDGVLVMTVNPGFAGQKLVPQTVNKVARLRKMLDENGFGHVRIEVDGNVSFDNIGRLRSAGADIFVGGTSSMFHKDHTVAENVAHVRRCLAEAEPR